MYVQNILNINILQQTATNGVIVTVSKHENKLLPVFANHASTLKKVH